MKKLLFLSALVLSLSLITPAYAAKPVTGGGPKTKTPLGVDVSWPQCDGKLPSNHAFGIVGVNGGKATTTNPCLAEQLVWASKAVGGTVQDKVQLYVNTANPGGLETPSWPMQSTVENPHGACDGGDTIACAWQYGWNRAYEAVHERFAPAVAQTTLDQSPSAYKWWLDVELENSWKEGGTDFDHQSNVAVLEGMTAYYLSIGAQVGLYSTSYQWGVVAGDAVSSDSNLIGLDNWRPGGSSQATAKQACDATPLTANGTVVLAQFVSRSTDYNISCI